MHDILNNLKFTKAKATGQVTASGTGEVVDLAGFKSVAFAILISAVAAADASNYLTFTVQEGSASDGSDMADIPAERILGSAVINNTAQDEQTLKIGAISDKQYVRLKWTETGTADVTFSAIAALGNPNHAPVA
jgi:hypothetical protein